MTRSGGADLWCLAVAETLVWAGIHYAFPALLSYWEQSLGFSKPQLTMTLSGALVVSALCAPFAGKLTDAGFGRRRHGHGQGDE